MRCEVRTMPKLNKSCGRSNLRVIRVETQWALLDTSSCHILTAKIVTLKPDFYISRSIQCMDSFMNMHDMDGLLLQPPGTRQVRLSLNAWPVGKPRFSAGLTTFSGLPNLHLSLSCLPSYIQKKAEVTWKTKKIKPWTKKKSVLKSQVTNFWLRLATCCNHHKRQKKKEEKEIS